MAEEKKTVKLPHSVILENRKGLNISRLNIETGELNVTGDISSLNYAESQASGGIFSRLFR